MILSFAFSLLISVFLMQSSSGMAASLQEPRDGFLKFHDTVIEIQSSKKVNRSQIRADKKQSSTPLTSLEVQEDALKKRMGELSIMPLTPQIIQQENIITLQLDEIVKERAALLGHRARRSVAANLGDSYNVQVQPSQCQHIKEALKRRAEAQRSANIWFVAATSGFSATFIFWKFKCPAPITLSSALATAACGFNAFRWYFRKAKEQKFIEQLRKSVSKDLS